MAYQEQTVTSIHRWSDKTFSFTTTRPDNFHFQNGEFVTLGLRPDGKLIPRAYSIVSNNKEKHLEFLSIHVPDGPLTSRLANVKVGDPIWVNSKPTGTLTLNHVLPGRNLYQFATGTGLAPFISLMRSPEIYQAFERIVLVHTVRTAKELAYKDELGKCNDKRFHYVPTVTREDFKIKQRGTDLFRSGELFSMCKLPLPDPEKDRIMICGNPNMIREFTGYLKENGWTSTSHRGIGNFTVEKAFVFQKD